MNRIFTYIILASVAISSSACQESIGALADRVASVSVEQCLQMADRLTDETMPRSVRDGEFWASDLA